MAKRNKKPSTALVLSGALVEFVRAEVAIVEGLKNLKTAQSDFDVCEKNKNLYSHALRALRQIAKRNCETGPWMQGHKTCNDAIEAGDHAANDRCWPCFARDALRRGGEQS